MPKRILTSIWLLVASLAARPQVADTLNRSTTPTGGFEALTSRYINIRFTPAQREHLTGREITLDFSVSETGVPTLKKISGITDSVVLDSLVAASQGLPPFLPHLQDGKPIPSIYRLNLWLQPSGPQLYSPPAPNQYKSFTADDFEYIREGGSHIDIWAGILANGLTGNAAQHLGPGGGMRIDMSMTGQRGWGAGLVMRLYGNPLTDPYQIGSPALQNTGPPTLLFGIGGLKNILNHPRGGLDLQLDLCYAAQNIITSTSQPRDGVQFSGFSPGLVTSYYFQAGKDQYNNTYGGLFITRYYIGMHAAVRPVWYDYTPASGLMLEAGLSVKISAFDVQDFREKVR
ncbi:MAG: hypothetical protein SF053_01285 [Bacteroidia bacterium]|nr:hypothetical protein [Bacteroidia bacterium]